MWLSERIPETRWRSRPDHRGRKRTCRLSWCEQTCLRSGKGRCGRRRNPGIRESPWSCQHTSRCRRRYCKRSSVWLWPRHSSCFSDQWNWTPSLLGTPGDSHCNPSNRDLCRAGYWALSSPFRSELHRRGDSLSEDVFWNCEFSSFAGRTVNIFLTSSAKLLSALWTGVRVMPVKSSSTPRSSRRMSTLKKESRSLWLFCKKYFSKSNHPKDPWNLHLPGVFG